MRIFLTKWFVRFARKERIGDGLLLDAIRRAGKGNFDADLGGHLIKQRVARPGGGKSGGYRTVIAYQAKARSVFLYGFAKSEVGNIDDRELADLKKLAARFLNMTDAEIGTALRASEIKEVISP